MRARSLVGVLTFAHAVALPAQEVAVWGASARPGPWDESARGAGVAIAAYMPLGALFTDSSSLARLPIHIGLRLALSDIHASQYTVWWCGAECGPQPPRTMRTRMRITQLTVQLLPYRSATTRVDVGVGVVTHAFRGDVDANVPGAAFTVNAARRIARHRPFWGMIGYDYQRAFMFDWPADGSGASTPAHIVRLGLVLRR